MSGLCVAKYKMYVIYWKHLSIDFRDKFVMHAFNGVSAVPAFHTNYYVNSCSKCFNIGYVLDDILTIV